MKMNIVLIVAGSLLLVAGIVLTVFPVKSNNQDINQEKEIVSYKVGNPQIRPSEAAINMTEPQSSHTAAPAHANAEASAEVKEESKTTDPKQTGNDFEGFVADMLKANGIALKEWNQGTTSPEGAYAENELNPDFRVIQKSERGSLEYWVECKYRSRLQSEGFMLENYQQERYKSIQGKSKRKILIALGVGGSANSPAQFYVIPLDTLVRFKRVGHKFLPHYVLANPRSNLKSHVEDWFYNDVFKKK